MNLFCPAVTLSAIVLALAGCATQGKPAPRISLDEPVHRSRRGAESVADACANEASIGCRQ